MIALLLAFAVQCPDGTPPPCRSATRPAPRNSIAVLYFENNSPDTSDVYLADGLTDELINQLARINRLQIAPRTTVRRLRGSAQDPAATARGLGVSHLVTGVVRRAGSRLRVDVELVRMPSQQRLWGESYQRADGDVFAIQEEIARAVASAVAGTLLPAERATLARAPTRNPDAYNAYLRGSAAFLREVSPTTALLAIAYFEQALERDPAFVAARGRLATVYGWALNWSLELPGMSQDSVLRRGLALARQGLREDSLSSDAWQALGWLLGFVPDYEGALVAARRAVELDSTSDRAAFNYGVLLRRTGQLDAAERLYRRTITINPAFDQAVADMGFLRLTQRRFSEARQWYDSAIVLLPSGWHHYGRRAEARLASGDTAGALADARASVLLSGDVSRHIATSQLAAIEGRAGDTGAARARVEPIRARFATGDIPVRDGFQLVTALAAAGRRDDALEVLERIRPRGAWLWSYLVLAEFDSLRDQPRFRRVLEESRPANAPVIP